ncbi:MAG: hypothetical protein ABSA11_01260 [Candidatus Bathyarchaeia archaeon]|jgi:hypothetical protein
MNKVVYTTGSRYNVRGLTFGELVKIGSANTESREIRNVMVDILSQCFVDPKLRRNQISVLDDQTLNTLVNEVLEVTRSNLDNMGFIPPHMDKGSLRDMIT